MEVSAFFWDERTVGPVGMRLRRLARRNPSRYFAVGNAGDLLAKDIIAYKYRASAVNRPERGGRLLCIGSVAHKIKPMDVVCGIGDRGMPIPPPHEAPCRVLGLRGPITYDAFRRAGHDLSAVRFLLDPGLLVRYMVDASNCSAPADVIFIPHYRERDRVVGRVPTGIQVVDVDVHPLKLAERILNAKMVYSSSLHGIVFAHALCRPCVFVRPQTREPLVKYEDYYAAVGVNYRKPIDSIEEARFARDSDSPEVVKFTPDDFAFPSIGELLEWGIAVDADPGQHRSEL